MSDDFWNKAGGPPAAGFGYLPPAKGSPHGLIVPLQQPATPAAVGATAMPGNLAPFQGYPGWPTVPLPPGAPPEPGNPYVNTDHQVVGTYMDENGNIVHDYTPFYNQYDPVSRQGFDIHEGVHVDRLNTYPHNGRGSQDSQDSYKSAPSQWEIPAYQKQIDFYQNYLMTHPMTAPDWANVLRTQQQMEDALDSFRKK